MIIREKKIVREEKNNLDDIKDDIKDDIEDFDFDDKKNQNLTNMV